MKLHPINCQEIGLTYVWDRSQDFYSVVVFPLGILVIKVTDPTELAFLFRKALITAMKSLTLPKLELQAAFLVSRLRQEVQRAISLNKYWFFRRTDSATILHWLHSLQKQRFLIVNQFDWYYEIDDSWWMEPCTDGWQHCQFRHSQIKCHGRWRFEVF